MASLITSRTLFWSPCRLGRTVRDRSVDTLRSILLLRSPPRKETPSPWLSRTARRLMSGLKVVTEYAGHLRFSALRAGPTSLLLFVGPAVLGLYDFVGEVGALPLGETVAVIQSLGGCSLGCFLRHGRAVRYREGSSR